jgi:RimJ/RimL family protein N-acetyltransferase
MKYVSLLPTHASPHRNPLRQEIQKATASEPLTLPAEHAMQQSWRLDHDKLTFIICRAPPSCDEMTPGREDAPENMVGDVNLFLSPASDADADADATGIVGELEIMIAPASARRQGFARAAVLAFLEYVTANLDGVLEEYRVGCDERSERYLSYLRVKIDQENGASVDLFEGLGFERVGGVNYFGEVEMRIQVREEKVVGLKGEGCAREVRYGV